MEPFTNDAFIKTKAWINNGNIRFETDMIRIVTLNISEKCQLQCSICPRSQGYPNQDIFMDLETVKQLKKRLDEINFQGIISISGMGEPCLHPKLLDICKILTPYKIKILTNGLADIDYKSLSHYADIYVTIHNQQSLSYLQNKFKDINVVFRNHDIQTADCELIQTNRGGWFINKAIQQPCYFPFYKLCIDYDGSYLLCPDDWKRQSKRTGIDIYNMDIEQYYCHYLLPRKKELIKNRIQVPCSQCNANGTLMGESIVKEYICQFKNE